MSVCAGSAGEADDKHAAPALQASHNFTLQPILMFILKLVLSDVKVKASSEESVGH